MTAVTITLRITGRILKMELTDQMLKILKRYLYSIRLPQRVDQVTTTSRPFAVDYFSCTDSISSMFEFIG